jgi:Ca2+-binding RTX toxin-like protein
MDPVPTETETPRDRRISVIAGKTMKRKVLSILVLGLASWAWAGQADAACAGRQPTIYGTPGPDRIQGTMAPDVIAALGGDDTVIGGLGNDIICAGAGNDTLLGGPSLDSFSYALNHLLDHCSS